MGSSANILTRNAQKAKVLCPDPRNIPAGLKGLPRWVLWRFEERDGRSTKVPYTVRGVRARVNRPEDGAPFAAVWNLYLGGSFDGVGLILVEEDGLVAVDLDGCRNPETGEVAPEAQRIVKPLRGYTEASPSGTGLRIIIRGKLSRPGVKRGNVELYASGRYVTVTGHVVGEPVDELPNRQAELDALLQELGRDFHRMVGELPDDAPPDVEALAEETLKRLPPFVRELWASGRTFEDRSGEAYNLAALCAEHGITSEQEIASVVYTSAAHQAKFARRSDGWLDALRCAERALAGSEDEVEPEAAPEQRGESLHLPESVYVAAGLAGKFAELFGHYYEVPKEYWLFSFLTILGARLAGKVTLRSDLQPEPRLYTVLLGRSGVEKKSTAIRRTLRFFEEAECAPPVCHGAGSAEGLAEVLAETKRLLLVQDEFRALLAKVRIEGAVLGPLLTTLYEADTYENRTKRHHIQVRNGHLSLLAASTFDSYQLVWDSHSLAIGLNNRLLVVAGQAQGTVPLVPVVPSAEETALQQRLRGLVEEVERRAGQEVVLRLTPDGVAATDAYELALSPEAQTVWERWYAKRPRDVYAARLDTIGQRLIILLALVRGELGVVSPETVEVVCQILAWQHRVRTAHDPIDAENIVARLEVGIQRQLQARGALTKRDLQRFTNASKYGLWAFKTALANLQADGRVRFVRALKKYDLTHRGAGEVS